MHVCVHLHTDKRARCYSTPNTTSPRKRFLLATQSITESLTESDRLPHRIQVHNAAVIAGRHARTESLSGLRHAGLPPGTRARVGANVIDAHSAGVAPIQQGTLDMEHFIGWQGLFFLSLFLQNKLDNHGARTHAEPTLVSKNASINLYQTRVYWYKAQIVFWRADLRPSRV